MRSSGHYSFVVGIDEAGRAAHRGEPRPTFIVGIDEAGRGSLAGPLVVAGIRIRIPATTPNSKIKTQNVKIWKKFKSMKLRDSKQLSARQREKWFEILTNDSEVEYAVAIISPNVIDRINVWQAAQRGAYRVWQKLKKEDTHTLLDGSLFLPKHVSQETIIKGDEKIPVISAASIIAKVTRDRIMMRMHKKYSQYRFDLHKGYGTKLHYEKIKQCGPVEIHRQSFRLTQSNHPADSGMTNL